MRPPVWGLSPLRFGSPPYCSCRAPFVALAQLQRNLAIRRGSRAARTEAVRGDEMSQELLVAEDDPGLAATLREYLERLGVMVRATSSAHVTRQWLQEAGGSVILAGSVLGHSGSPLRQ